MKHFQEMHDRMGKQIKLLFLIDRMHSTEGGAEGVVDKLSRLLPSYGFQCQIATFWAGERVAERLSCPLHVLPLTSMYGWNALRCAKQFTSLLRSEQVDIVHTFFPASDLWGGVVARLSGCPVVTSSRRDMGILRSKKHRVLYRAVNQLFDQVHAVSESVRQFSIVEDRLSPDRVVTVHNGVDLKAIDAAEPGDRHLCFGAKPDQPVIAAVANIRRVKGIDVLVQAAALVVREVPNAIFAVIGAALQERDYWEAIQNEIEGLGLGNNFRFLGQRSDVQALLKQADIFCLPSRSEGMSNALLEAMACRLPCVATSVGGTPEVIVDGVSGFLVGSEDWAMLAARMLTLLRDPARARRMADEGRRVVESRFTLNHVAQTLSQLYNDLLSKKLGLIPTSTSPPQGLVVHSEMPIAEQTQELLPSPGREVL
jgi:glycosyltransferase involved in cell wall biosynthesis